MSLYIASINSGSNGNCYYVGNENEAVLVDAGISCREIEKRMKRIGLTMSKVKAVFITHEHSDHIRGLEVLAKKHYLPVYINQKTMHYGRLNIDNSLVRPIQHHVPIEIGELSVIPFSKVHDAADPYSFVVKGNGYNVGVITDIGHACENVVHAFKSCHAVFLESNYDVHMLNEGRYPVYLKQRIKGGKGHISNEQALELFLNHKADHLQHLLLAHLSHENNNPTLVKDLFEKHAGNVNVVVASRYGETKVYRVGVPEEKPEPVEMPSQMSMFN